MYLFFFQRPGWEFNQKVDLQHFVSFTDIDNFCSLVSIVLIREKRPVNHKIFMLSGVMDIVFALQLRGLGLDSRLV